MRKVFYLFLLISMGILTIPVISGYAQSKYQIKEMTPEISTALENRKARFDVLRELKSKGIIGENNRGYVETLKSDEQAEEIAQAENSDRKVIYQTIAKQNGIESQLSTIEKVFAQVQRDKAMAGEQIQAEDGSWITK